MYYVEIQSFKDYSFVLLQNCLNAKRWDVSTNFRHRVEIDDKSRSKIQQQQQKHSSLSLSVSLSLSLSCVYLSSVLL